LLLDYHNIALYSKNISYCHIFTYYFFRLYQCQNFIYLVLYYYTFIHITTPKQHLAIIAALF